MFHRYRGPLFGPNIYLLFGTASELRARFRANKTSLSTDRSFPTDRSKAVPLLDFFFVCAYVISYVLLVVSSTG